MAIELVKLHISGIPHASKSFSTHSAVPAEICKSNPQKMQNLSKFANHTPKKCKKMQVKSPKNAAKNAKKSKKCKKLTKMPKNANDFLYRNREVYLSPRKFANQNPQNAKCVQICKSKPLKVAKKCK